MPTAVWQLSLESQHPCGQVVGLHVKPTHTPSLHAEPAGQALHGSPSLPQTAFVVPGWQLSLWSQHPAHDSSLHMVFWHAPPMHCWFGPQSLHETPAVPQSKT